MIYQKYIARCYRVYQHERNEHALFLSILNRGRKAKMAIFKLSSILKKLERFGIF